VKRFGDEDRAGHTEVFLAGDESSTTEVGRGANTLKDRSEGDEGLGILEREVISASSDGSGASTGDGAGQELNVLFLVADDVKQILVIQGREAGIDKVLLAHHADATFVEDILKMLEGKSVLQDVQVSDGCLSLFGRVSESGIGEEQSCC